MIRSWISLCAGVIATMTAHSAAGQQSTPIDLRNQRPLEPYRVGVELGLTPGVAFPGCDDECVEVGVGAYAFALWRPDPSVAFGAAFRFSRFPWALSSGGTGWVTSRQELLLARLYFLESGRFDPFVEAGVGLTSLNFSEPLAYSVSPGLTLAGAIGCDYFVTRALRIGPWLGYSMATATESGTSSTSSAETPAAPLKILHVGLSVTLVVSTQRAQ